MVWCSPLSFWTHHELYPQPKFVCCPNGMRCRDTRSAHLPWAHSLNWIVRLASFLTIRKQTHSYCWHIIRAWHYAVQKALSHTYHSQCLKPGSPSPWFGVFGGWWVIFWSMSAFLSPPPLPRGNEGMISSLSSTRHSPKKQTGTFYGPACWPTAQEQQQQATSGVYFRMSYLNWYNSTALLTTHTIQFPYRDPNIL